MKAEGLGGIGKGLNREAGKGKKFIELWRAGRTTLKRGFIKEGDRLIWKQR